MSILIFPATEEYAAYVRVYKEKEYYYMQIDTTGKRFTKQEMLDLRDYLMKHFPLGKETK